MAKIVSSWKGDSWFAGQSHRWSGYNSRWWKPGQGRVTVGGRADQDGIGKPDRSHCEIQSTSSHRRGTGRVGQVYRLGSLPSGKDQGIRSDRV